MMHFNHFYLVVFNLKTPSVVIIENHHRHADDIEDIIKIYNGVSDILVISDASPSMNNMNLLYQFDP